MTYKVKRFSAASRSDGMLWAAAFEGWLNRQEAGGLEFIQDIGHGLVVFKRRSPEPRDAVLKSEPGLYEA